MTIELEVKEKDGMYSIDCPLGLWGVTGSDKKTVVAEAMRYFWQYAGDGEYDKLVGPPSK